MLVGWGNPAADRRHLNDPAAGVDVEEGPPVAYSAAPGVGFVLETSDASAEGIIAHGLERGKDALAVPRWGPLKRPLGGAGDDEVPWHGRAARG